MKHSLFFFILWFQNISRLPTVHSSVPIALHQLIQVKPGEEIVLNLQGFDEDKDEVRCPLYYTTVSHILDRAHERHFMEVYCILLSHTIVLHEI